MDEIERLMMYATALTRNPEATYRRIDVAGRTAHADGPALVQLLYSELTSALRAAAHAADVGNQPMKSERVTRATAILFALEAGLDFDQGGEISRTLATLYAGARAQVVQASIGRSGAPFRRVAADLDEIAAAWATIRAA